MLLASAVRTAGYVTTDMVILTRRGVAVMAGEAATGPAFCFIAVPNSATMITLSYRAASSGGHSLTATGAGRVIQGFAGFLARGLRLRLGFSGGLTFSAARIASSNGIGIEIGPFCLSFDDLLTRLRSPESWAEG